MWESFIYNKKLNHLENTYYADSMFLFRDLLPDLNSYSLFNVHYHLFGKNIENAHDALDDVLAMKKITEYLISTHCKTSIHRTIYHTTTTSSILHLTPIENIRERLINYSIPVNANNFYSVAPKSSNENRFSFFLNKNIVQFPFWDYLYPNEKEKLLTFFKKNNMMHIIDLFSVFTMGISIKFLRLYSDESYKIKRAENFKMYMRNIIANRRVIGLTTDYFTSLCNFSYHNPS